MQLHESVNPLIECVSLCRKIQFKCVAVDPEQRPTLPMQHRRAHFSTRDEIRCRRFQVVARLNWAG
jgi:hypothetical protein